MIVLTLKSIYFYFLESIYFSAFLNFLIILASVALIGVNNKYPILSTSSLTQVFTPAHDYSSTSTLNTQLLISNSMCCSGADLS